MHERVNSNNSRIDTFLAEFLARNEEFKWFWFVSKLFSLSRVDRARLRGVLMLIKRPWLKISRRSLKGQRIIYDHIQSENIKFQDFKLTNELVNICKAAHERYTIPLEENKLSVIENEKKVKRKLIDDEINHMKKRKLDLETFVETLKKDADRLSFEAEKKNDSTLLITANSFRKTATEKTESVSVLDKAIMKLQEEKENMKILIGFKPILVALIASLYSAFHQTNAFDVKLKINRLRLSLLRYVCYSEFYEYIQSSGITLLLLYNLLRPDPTKWSNIPTPLLLLTNCLNVFDDFVGSASKWAIF